MQTPYLRFLLTFRLVGLFLALAGISLGGFYSSAVSQAEVSNPPVVAKAYLTDSVSAPLENIKQGLPPESKAPTITVGLPKHLRIPDIGVDTDLDMVGLTSTRAMENPPTWDRPAWYKFGWLPGQSGNAVIAGHLDSNCCPAVFWRLHELKPGMLIYILDSIGKKHVFSVRQSTSYDVSNPPLMKIFGSASSHNLNLITCNGVYSPFIGQYNERLVVYSTEVDSFSGVHLTETQSREIPAEQHQEPQVAE